MKIKKIMIVWCLYIAIIYALYIFSSWLVDGDKMSLYVAVPIIAGIPAMVFLKYPVKMTRIIIDMNPATLRMTFKYANMKYRRDNAESAYEEYDASDPNMPGTPAYYAVRDVYGQRTDYRADGKHP